MIQYQYNEIARSLEKDLNTKERNFSWKMTRKLAEELILSNSGVTTQLCVGRLSCGACYVQNGGLLVRWCATAIPGEVVDGDDGWLNFKRNPHYLLHVSGVGYFVCSTPTEVIVQIGKTSK